MNKLTKYLSSKQKNDYTVLDRLLALHAEGRLQAHLREASVDEFRVLPKLSPDGNCLLIYFSIQNIHASVDLYETQYDCVIYAEGEGAEAVERQFVDRCYNADFDLLAVLDRMIADAKNDTRLRDIIAIKRRRKRLKVLATVCFVIPCVLLFALVAYVTVAQKNLPFSPWYLLLLLIPYALSVFFDLRYAKSFQAKKEM